MKKLKDVETIWDFEEILVELANKNPLFYAPLSFKYQILLDKHKTFLRIIGIIHFIGGLLTGILLANIFS